MALLDGYDPESGTFNSIKPVIQAPINTTTYTSSSNWGASSRRISFWSRFNNGVATIGNWFANSIDKMIGIICMLVIIGIGLGALIAVITIWTQEGFFFALIAAVIGFFIGYIALGLLWYVINIAVNVIMIGLRLVFWNGWTLITILLLSVCACVWLVLAPPSYNYIPQTKIETTMPMTSIYVCTANVLNIRSAPNTYSSVIGTLKKGEKVQVYEVSNGFARISYNGRIGYVSIKYINIIQ